MTIQTLKSFLDKKVEQYNQPAFIEQDPISIPHRFSRKQDIEIAGFFAAVFSWGNRTTILQKCRTLLQCMDHSPCDFIKNCSQKDLQSLKDFSHRTFQYADLLYFIYFLRRHYIKYDSLESAFTPPLRLERGQGGEVETRLNYFRTYFFSYAHEKRTEKHISSPARHSACKRLNMFLRWMVRKDDKGVDFGIWSSIRPSHLICPLDVHVARTARRLGLLKRKQTDWQSALELTEVLRKLDARDPVKYDFALFNLGRWEKQHHWLKPETA